MTTEPDTLTCSRCGLVSPLLYLVDWQHRPIHYSHQACIDALRDEIDSMSAFADTLADRMLADDITLMHAGNASMATENVTLTEIVAQLTSLRAAAKAKWNEWKEVAGDWRTDCHVAERAVTALRAELAVMREERDACLVELDTIGNERMRMQGEIALHRERNSVLSAELDTLRTERTTMRAEIATLRAPRVASDAMVDVLARVLCADYARERTVRPLLHSWAHYHGQFTQKARQYLTAAFAANTEPT